VLPAENQRRNAMCGRGRPVGADGPVAARMTEPLEPRPLALGEDELLDIVLSAAPRVLAAQATAESGRANLHVARSQYLPTVRLSSSYDWNNREIGFQNGLQSWRAAIGISYPLFNGFSREQNLDRAQADLATAQARLRDARASVRADFEQALGYLRLAEDRLALTEEAVGMAEEDLRVQEERYRLGASTMLEQITSQLNLVQAEMNHVAARYDYQIARAELEALVGRDL
jgi:outer membrane protein